jgi:eukaryotic-like serine/threonine-protein kinase
MVIALTYGFGAKWGKKKSMEGAVVVSMHKRRLIERRELSPVELTHALPPPLQPRHAHGGRAACSRKHARVGTFPAMNPADPASRLAAALADRYRLDRELGAGGMATVYLARDLKHDRDVAIKVLKPELGAVLGAERFLNEIRTTAKLQHPHLLPLFDSGEVDGLLYYVMPYVEGDTLHSRIRAEQQLSVDTTIRLITTLAGALDFAHARGVVHRDLKPENILLQAGQPVIADFGIALAVAQAGGERITGTGLSLGTPHYMSPEQAAGTHTVDARSDQYALGAIAYELLMGEPPHTGATTPILIARLMTEAPRSIRSTRPAVPAGVEAAILRALEKAPADRFSSCGAFAAALANGASEAGTAPAATAHEPRVLLPKPASRRFLPFAALVALAAVIVAVALRKPWNGVRSTRGTLPRRAPIHLGGRRHGQQLLRCRYCR